jgi:hypothetical protein
VTSRTNLIATIEALGEAACCYTGRDWVTRHCDCKYGRWTDHPPLTSEQTGCPELRQIHRVLTHTDDDTWHTLLRRAGYPPPARRPAGDDIAFGPQ